jgi:hypothetical protein
MEIANEFNPVQDSRRLITEARPITLNVAECGKSRTKQAIATVLKGFFFLTLILHFLS